MDTVSDRAALARCAGLPDRPGWVHADRAAAQAARSEEAFRHYVKETAAESKPSTADDLVKLTDLHDRGAISTEDYDRAKAMVLNKDERVPAMDRHQQPTT